MGSADEVWYGEEMISERKATVGVGTAGELLPATH